MEDKHLHSLIKMLMPNPNAPSTRYQMRTKSESICSVLKPPGSLTTPSNILMEEAD